MLQERDIKNALQFLYNNNNFFTLYTYFYTFIFLYIYILLRSYKDYIEITSCRSNMYRLYNKRIEVNRDDHRPWLFFELLTPDS